MRPLVGLAVPLSAVLLTLLASGKAPAQIPPCQVSPISLGQNVVELLWKTDCRSPLRGSSYLADRYAFSVNAGREVAIWVESRDFDTYLYLIGPNGQVVVEDDNGLPPKGSTNSRIPPESGWISLRGTGTHTIEVTSAKQFGAGNYLLHLEAPDCLYSVTHATPFIPGPWWFLAAGGVASVNVSATPGCTWSASSNAGWVTTSSNVFIGSGSTTYAVAPNTTTQSRTGTLTVAGQPFTVVQTGTCGISVSPNQATFPAAGGTGSVSLWAPFGCTWATDSNDGWMAITSIGGSVNFGWTINYSVGPNPSSQPRRGTLAIADQNVTVTQAGQPCTYSITPASTTVRSQAQTSSVRVRAPDGCGWSATSHASWITFPSGAASGASGSGMQTSGSGDETVLYSVAANTAASSRTGTLTVAGQAFTVTQEGACTHTLSASSASYGPASATGAVEVTPNGPCFFPWTATSNAGWVHITSGNQGSGYGVVSYWVDPNTSGTNYSRTGTLTIAGQPFTVLQQGTCPVSQIAIGQTVNGELRAGDCPSPLRPVSTLRPGPAGFTYHADRYSFTGLVGQWVVIRLESDYRERDSYLYVIGPDGSLVAENDDYDGRVQGISRVPTGGSFVLPATGTYVIEVTSQGFPVGAYTFWLLQGTSPPCAPSRITPGQTVNGRLGPGDCFNGGLGLSQGQPPSPPGYVDQHIFSISSPREVEIEMTWTSSDDASIYLIDAAGVVRDANGFAAYGSTFYAARRTARIRTRLTEPGTYIIQVVPVPGTGDYSLTLR